MEALIGSWPGWTREMGLAAIYAEHANLFSAEAIEALRDRAEKDDDVGRQAREHAGLALHERVAATVADLTNGSRSPRRRPQSSGAGSGSRTGRY